jgi:cell division protein FtsI/penicillin-binding protein 2
VGLYSSPSANRSGLEESQNDYLTGSNSDLSGVLAREFHSITGGTVKGNDVVTSLEPAVQSAAFQGLKATGHPGAAVAYEPSTGRVVALASWPTYNPNAAVLNTPAWLRTLHAPDGPLLDRVTQGLYPPGSTFKVITATAALLAGKTEATPLDCPAVKLVSGRPFKNANNEAFGLINLRTAFAQSCNTAFINLRQSITEADMKRAALLYGFDETQPLPITSYGGSYPVPSGPVDEAASAFGQAAVLASPLQMATVAAAVASGSWRKPFLVGATTVTHPIPANVDAALKDMMRAVVTEGTAAPSVVTFPGLVYGKTGTAEEGSTAQNLPTDAWFIGWRNTTAFAVIVPGGGFGASVAAPIASRFLTNLGPS